MSNRYFHFTLGPVQGFVAQARRTRDFWAGSFLLSWLSAIAMRSVEKQGGKILFPLMDDAFRRALDGEKDQKDRPIQGSVPNRFKAEVRDGFEPKRVVASVQQAWRDLGEDIWKGDLKKLEGNAKAREIWEEQIKAFWDIQWAIVDDVETSNSIDRLKNWRTHLPPDQPGTKCMMMDGWRELSGAERPGRNGRSAFWESLRDQKLTAIQSDLRDGEMLCAIAYVKRRFVRYFPGFNTKLPDWTAHGWKLPSGVPSVHYLAAAHWLARLIRQTKQDEALSSEVWAFHDAARKLTDKYGEWQTNIRCVQEANGHHKWEALNGEVFFDTMLENRRLWRDSPDNDGPRVEQARALAKRLRRLGQQAKLDAVPPFYAVLLMDGDQLGVQMSDPGNQDTISQALLTFTKGVPARVVKHNGFLIYAGGDDVLAILPVDDALDCALDLRRHYQACFEDSVISTSLSGAIEYAHVKMPLGKILGDAHPLLDDVAKDGHGRDAIACRVWKPGGRAVEWAMPWALAADDQGVIVQRIADDFASDDSEPDSNGNADFANKFFYRLRDHFQLEFDDAVMNRVAAMEFLNSGLVRGKEWTMNRASERIEPLLKQCRPKQRQPNTAPENWPAKPASADAAMLVRFLAQKGVDR